jgi:hypothetical protein
VWTREISGSSTTVPEWSSSHLAGNLRNIVELTVANELYFSQMFVTRENNGCLRGTVVLLSLIFQPAIIV